MAGARQPTGSCEQDFQRLFPQVRLDINALYVDAMRGSSPRRAPRRRSMLLPVSHLPALRQPCRTIRSPGGMIVRCTEEDRRSLSLSRYRKHPRRGINEPAVSFQQHIRESHNLDRLAQRAAGDEPPYPDPPFRQKRPVWALPTGWPPSALAQPDPAGGREHLPSGRWRRKWAIAPL